jgi:hypothetical protein
MDADVREFNIGTLQDEFESGGLTSAALCEAFLGRIAAIDRAGPTLRSVIELNPDAVGIAADLDAERRLRGPRGPLHGVPIMVKDSIDTADGRRPGRLMTFRACPLAPTSAYRPSRSPSRPFAFSPGVSSPTAAMLTAVQSSGNQTTTTVPTSRSLSIEMVPPWAFTAP